MSTFAQLRQWTRGERAAYLVEPDGEIRPVPYDAIRSLPASLVSGILTLDAQRAAQLAAAIVAARARVS